MHAHKQCSAGVDVELNAAHCADRPHATENDDSKYRGDNDSQWYGEPLQLVLVCVNLLILWWLFVMILILLPCLL